MTTQGENKRNDAETVADDPTLAGDATGSVEVVAVVRCRRCGGGFDGPAAVRLALEKGMFRVKCECCGREAIGSGPALYAIGYRPVRMFAPCPWAAALCSECSNSEG